MNEFIISKVFIVLGVRVGTESKYPSIVFLSIHPDQLTSGPGKCLGILSSAVFSK